MKNFFFLLSLVTLNAWAQDPALTNVQSSLMGLNPSFAGSNGFLRYQSTTRSQWYDLTGSYMTYYNGFDMYIKPMMGGIGVAYTRDDQARGTLVTDRIDLNYAQHISLFKNKLKIIPSLQVSVFQKTLDQSKLNFGDQIQPRRGFFNSIAAPQPNSGISRKTNLDFSSGLIINYKHLYIGSTMYHITQPDEGVYYGPSKLPFRISSFVSYNLPLGEKFLLNGLYRFEKQNSFAYHQLNINALLFKYATIGAGIRTHNIMTVSAGFRYHYFTITGGYEFGLPKNAYGPSKNPSYELAASFNLRNKENRKKVTDMERW